MSKQEHLQYNRVQQSKSQCKGGLPTAANSGLKKSFSIALLKAGTSGAQSQLAGEVTTTTIAPPSEYNNSGGHSQQQQPANRLGAEHHLQEQ